jgi:hypothetical protein
MMADAIGPLFMTTSWDTIQKLGGKAETNFGPNVFHHRCSQHDVCETVALRRFAVAKKTPRKSEKSLAAMFADIFGEPVTPHPCAFCMRDCRTLAGHS